MEMLIIFALAAIAAFSTLRAWYWKRSAKRWDDAHTRALKELLNAETQLVGVIQKHIRDLMLSRDAVAAAHTLIKSLERQRDQQRIQYRELCKEHEDYVTKARGAGMRAVHELEAFGASVAYLIEALELSDPNRGVPEDAELPGMWSRADLIGGETDQPQPSGDLSDNKTWSQPRC